MADHITNNRGEKPLDSAPAAEARKRAASPFLTGSELARRWQMSVRTLEGWRSPPRKVPFIKVSGRVLYRLTDIERLEVASETHPSQW
ncbi:hypothetical protein [Sphingomonas sp. BK235]|uniref:hypothetical protein n=1 Tax=Sphingomonas sp. BK235 TaxID=2512131 RepID=UPI001053B7E8|nr:hypothetical protein [Sphingomonas sp. BK235]TCP37574.1 hypothetical protein EV292_1011099 [Sphingomonas sp. BK235]